MVITGGSRGLGLVIARRLARENARLVLIARSGEELSRAAEQIGELGAEVLTVAADIGDAQQVDEAIALAVSHFGTIDVLINDAGTIQVGPIEHMTLDDFEQAMRVNFWGALYTMAAVLPHMRAQNAGRIVNISSIGGQIAMPHMSPYSASKFALVGLSDALRAELAKDNILISTVCPTLIRTGSPRNASFKGRASEEYAWFAVADSLPGLSISAETAAERIIRAARYGLPSTYVSPVGRVIAVLSRVAPELSADVSAMVARLLPAFDAKGDTRNHRGADVESEVTQSRWTLLSRLAAAKNNEDLN